jgi:hypothetical protein
MREGDMVYPSKTNPVYGSKSQFRGKNAVFPWKVHRIKGETVWVDRPTKTGGSRPEKWFIEFWTTEAPITC